MAVAVAARTLGQVFVRVAQLARLWENQGTATAGTTTTLTDATNERMPIANKNARVGKFLYVFGGTSIGTIRELIDYATLGIYTWVGAATAPDTTSTWILVKVNPNLILDAIASVTRMGAFLQAQPYVSEAIVTNNLLHHYGAMEEWAAGTSSAPDGWTLGGAGAAVARSTTAIRQGLYSASLTPGAGAAGTLTRTLPNEMLRLLDSQSLTLLGFMANTTAADAIVRVTTTNSAGTATNTDRTSTYASDRLEDLRDISQASISVPDNVVSVAVQLRGIAAAAACYFDDIILYGPRLYDYDLPATLIGMEPTIWMETDYGNHRFTLPLVYNHDWHLIKRDGSTARTLHFTKALPSARHLRINGVRAPDVQTTVGSNVEPNPEWLALSAAVNLVRSQPFSDEQRALLRDLQGELDKMERQPEGDTLYGRRIINLENP